MKKDIQKALDELYGATNILMERLDPKNETDEKIKKTIVDNLGEISREAQENDDLIAEQESELEGLRDDLDDEKKASRDDLEEAEDKISDLESTVEDSKQPQNLYDEQKREITLRLEQLTLAQLEHIEANAKENHRNYRIA